MTPRRILFFTNTPAHVHLYKNAIRRLQEMGHEVRVFGRDYGCTKDLLDYYDLPYEIYGRLETKKASLARELPKHYARILPGAYRFDPDVVFGIGAYAAHAGAITGARTILLFDSEPSAGLDDYISRPFVDVMLSPYTFQAHLGPNHYTFHGLKESAYLHPDEYEPVADVREQLGVGPDEKYVILRFNAWGSHHDVGKSGFTDRQRDELIERLSEHARVFVSDEAVADSAENEAVAFDFHPALMHDALSEASLLVADTQTMVTEAALLGTPAIRSNAFVGEDDMGNFLELEERGLVYNLRSFDEVLGKSIELLSNGDLRAEHAARREEYMSELVNLTDLIVAVATAESPPDGIDQLTPSTVPAAPAHDTR